MDALLTPCGASAPSIDGSRPPASRLVPIFALFAGLAFSLGEASPAHAQPVNEDVAKEDAAAAAIDEDAAAVEHFKAAVEPLLVAHCYDCHSHESGEASGGLVLDSRSGWSVGGDSGPAIVPGKPDESLFVRAIGYDDLDVQMPPDGKLDAEAITTLTEWIRRGAVDPRGGAAVEKKNSAVGVEEGRDFWAYRPIERPPVPVVNDAAWSETTIDRFVLARLEQEGFPPAESAERETLVRRLYLDLTGLPPTPEEIDAFLADDAPDAWERLVDRLLASPAFGERFARRWLDVVRYGESMTLRGLVFQEAWRFRDYVIDAYDRDRPFDRVMAEHVAGDLTVAQTLEARQRGRIATGFLVMGNKNLEDQDKHNLDLDTADEQLDTIGKVFLGQTIGCARCHDHKFDPIPTRDYYAMAGILMNSQSLVHSNVSGWTEDPLPLAPKREAAYAAHEAEAKRLNDALADAKKRLTALAKGTPNRPGDGMISVGMLAGTIVDDADAKPVGYWKPSEHTRPFVGAGYLHDENVGKGEKTLTFTAKLPKPGDYEVRFAYTPGTGRATNVPVTVFSADGEKTILVNERETPTLDGPFVSLGRFRFEKDGQSFVLVSNEATDGHVIADAVQFLPVDDLETPAPPTDAEQLAAQRALAKEAELKDEVARLQREAKAHAASLPPRPMAMSIRERPSDEIEDMRIRIRGMPHNLGEEVPRGFLQVVSVGPPPTIPEGESGRRELGEWLASPNNPLPARVYANRVWMWLIGEGLVRTPDNFGASGEPPSHPELLDWLASRLQKRDWSTKDLVREIVLSRTYRMSSATDFAHPSPGQIADPENRLLHRAHVKRTDAEALRDTMLDVAGRLDRRRFGTELSPSVKADYDYVAQGVRRTIYLPALRNATPEIVKIFDGADPSAVTGKRSESASAAQALFLLNDEFVQETATATARRLIEEESDFDSRLSHLYRGVLGRAPSTAEREIARDVFTDEAGASFDAYSDDVERWATICWALFASVDFRRTY